MISKTLALAILMEGLAPIRKEAEAGAITTPVTLIGDPSTETAIPISTVAGLRVQISAAALRLIVKGGPHNRLVGAFYGVPISFPVEWETPREQLLAAIDNAQDALHHHYHGGEEELVGQVGEAIDAVRDAANAL